MCRSMVDIQSPTAEIRRGKQKKKKEEERNYRMKIYMVSLLHRATITRAGIRSKTKIRIFGRGKYSYILITAYTNAL